MMFTICMKDSSEYSHLNESRVEEKFHDVVIRVGDRLFPCHRVILASTMKYFRNMFSGNYGVEAEKKEVEVKYVNADDFELLLTYVYGGSVSVAGNSILRLFKISHYMGPQSLEDACTELIIQNISTFSLDSALSIFMFACKRQNNFTLTEGLMSWAAENFVHLSEREEFLPISGFDLQKILVDSHLHIDSNAVLDFLLNWAKFHTEEERKLLPELLNVISLEEAPIEWILKILINSAYQPNTFGNSDEDDLLSHHITVESFMEMDMNEGIDETEAELPFLLVCRVTPRADVQNDVCVLKYGTKNDIQFVDSYSSKMKYDDVSFKCKIVYLGDLQLTVFSTFTVDDEKDYFYRYTTKLFASNHLKKKDFSFSTHNGDAVSSLSIPNNNGYQKDAHLTVATVDSNLFLYNNVQFIVCNCERNDWFNVPMRNFEKTISPNLLSLNNSLYMIGGKYFKDSYPGSTIDNKLEFSSASVRERLATDGKLFQRYDLREGKWTQLPSMNYARSKSASCIYDDNVYVTGGDNLAYYKNYNAEYFDTRINKWNVIATPMPKSKMNHSITVYNDKLWLFGGENAGPSLNDDLTMFSYDLKENSWSNVFPLAKSYGQFYTIKQILDAVVKI